jgi:uncharacterized tellurite resistance protein B-like protein
MSSPSVADCKTFIALLCRVAWADREITPEEVLAIREVAEKMGLDGDIDVMMWIGGGVPDSEIRGLPASMREYFYYEAYRVAQVDGELVEAEVRVLDQLLCRVFTHQGDLSLPRTVLTVHGID